MYNVETTIEKLNTLKELSTLDSSNDLSLLTELLSICFRRNLRFSYDTNSIMINNKIDGEFFSTDELIDAAIKFKHDGNYSVAIRIYICVIGSFLEIKDEIPVYVVRSLYKVLVCSNDYAYAYFLAKTVYQYMLENTGAGIEQFYFSSYLSVLEDSAKSIVNDNDYNQLFNHTGEMSGNSYDDFVKDLSDIYKDMQFIIKHNPNKRAKILDFFKD